jgi:competence protein ComEA
MASTPPPYMASSHTQAQQQIVQQQTIPLPATPISTPPMPPFNQPEATPTLLSKWHIKRIIPIVLVLASLVGIYFIWSTSNTSPAPSTNAGITQQSFGTGSSSTSVKSNSSSTSGEIKVYVVGAVKHPGVYTLATDARVYDLLQAAGGPLPKANLVALNLAARLTDGEEVYVTLVGETPPTYMGGVPGPGTGTNSSTTNTGQLVNINTASADEMRQSLHLSSTTANAIVNYRLQHGDYTSVDQLLQVVSKTIYDKIKDQVTLG